MPFEPGASIDDLRRGAREKAAALNQHVLGYGALAEAEWRAAGIADPDLAAMRKYRLERIRAELKRRDYAGALLYDPVNIRYATDSTNMQLWVAHNPTRHCFVATEGPVVLFDYFSCEHLSDHSGVVDEVRPAVSWMYLYGGELSDRRVERWAAGIADLVRQHGGGNRRIAVDHLDHEGVAALARLGISVGNGEAVMENARLIKSPDEILCMRRAIVSCEAAMGEMQAALIPGISENELWAELHRGNIARGGEWIETRLLSSGPRTNPWFQECSSRIIEAGDLVAFDTDLIGPYGFCADLSRTWLCGDGQPSNEQSDLYRIAAGQIAHNTQSDEARHRLPRSRRTIAKPAAGLFSGPLRRALPRRRAGRRISDPAACRRLDRRHAGRRAGTGHGAVRRKLYRPARRARGRQDRGAGADHGERQRETVELPARRSPACRLSLRVG